MNFRSALIAIALICSGCTSSNIKPDSDDGALPVYLMLGQSNMLGMRSIASELPDRMKKVQNNALFYKKGKWVPLAPGVSEDKGFGPEISFANKMEGNGEFGIIKVSQGATTLFKDWNPKKPKSLYAGTILMTEEAAKTRPIKIVGVLWMQGESDGSAKEMADAYSKNLELLVHSLKRDLNAENLKVSACRVTSPVSQFPYTETVRRAQESVRIDGYRWFDCDSISKGPDNLHYDTAGQVKLGQLFYESLTGQK